MPSSGSIVLELQRLASDSSVPAVDLLKKALIVAKKLRLRDFEAWIVHELDGYPVDSSNIPPYRELHCEIKARNPYHGFIPVAFHEQKMKDAFCTVKNMQGVAAIEDLLTRREKHGDFFTIPLSARQEVALDKAVGEPTLPLYRTVSGSQLAGILDAVRTTILKWSLQLEEEGILGSEVTFTDEEKQSASQSTQIHIENFHGVLGNVSQSTIKQDFTVTVHQGDLESLKAYLEDTGVDKVDLKRLGVAIEEDPTQGEVDRFGPKVSAWIAKMVKKASMGVWQVGVAAAGRILSKAISSYYGL